jgi:hypothetical protein
VEEVCAQFESAWKAGRRPSIEEYTNETPESLRTALLPELIALDIEYRRMAGVVLALAAVDGLHVQGVTEYEGDLLLGAEVRQPVPAKQALDGDDQPVAERRDGVQERRAGRRQVLVEDDDAVGIEDAQVHAPGMQIDPTVESVLTLVEAHHGPPWAWVRRLSPHRGWQARPA